MMKTTLLKIILSLAISVGFVGCAGFDPHTKHFTSLKNYPKSRKIMVRLTTYSVNEKRGDKWTRKLQSSTGIKLQNKYSAAVDPKIIPYFSKIEIPEVNLSLFSHDTGSAVKSRLASRRTGKQPIIDVFFQRESEAREFRLNNPQIVEAYIYN